MIKCQNITHNFDYPLFENISLEINRGESVAIIGVSGSGKSTLLHVLSSFLKPTSGKVEILGVDPYTTDQSTLNKIRRDSLGLIFQQHYLFRGFSANENLQVAAKLSGQVISQDLLIALGIDHVLDQDSAKLSGGQQQRLSVARVLTKKPKIIFADEPTGNLDQKTANDTMSVIFDYVATQSGAMMLVTHDEELAFRASKVYKLENLGLTQLK